MKPRGSYFGLLLTVFLFIAPLSQAEAGLDLVTIPTTKTLLKGDIDIDLELYGNGGVLVRSALGVTNYLTLGLPIDIKYLIGREEVDIDLPIPVWARLRLMEGFGLVPTISLGYDPAEYGEEAADTAEEGARGAYLALSWFSKAKKISLRPVLEVHAPGKEPDFNEVRAAVGLDLLLGKRWLLLAEADQIPFYQDRIKDESRLNAGLGFFFTPHLLAGIHFNDLREDKPERRVKIEYTRAFF
ncbi:MAG: hypothetical protein AB1797_11090 [bacterium]